MQETVVVKLETTFGRCVQRDLLMKYFTTVGIGGPARALIRVMTEPDLIRVIHISSEEGIPMLLIGGGSNLLVSDEGVQYLVVKNEVTGIERRGDIVMAKSGTALQDLVDYCLINGLDGLHRLTGIPGTVGGAVYGNAGAYGQTISDCLAEVVCHDGRRALSLSRSDCCFGYRDSAFKSNGLSILEVRLRLRTGTIHTLNEESGAILAQRLAKYPSGLRCSGSFFKNMPVESIPSGGRRLIPDDRIIFGKVPAGFLLQEVGARGQTLGGIQIAPTNANLFVNRGDGRAMEMVRLASEQAQRVLRRFGIKLSPEVQLVGLPPI